MESERTTFSVAAFNPFWRYAVCPSSNSSPGIPFFKLSAALEFFQEAQRELPWADCYLIRRCLFRGVEVVSHYKGKPFSLTDYGQKEKEKG